MIKYVSFAKVLDWLGAGFPGPSLQHWVEGLLGEVDAEPEYTVYWPKDSIRAIPGSSYAVAVTVLAVLAILAILADSRRFSPILKLPITETPPARFRASWRVLDAS